MAEALLPPEPRLTEAGGGKQEGMFQRGAPVASLGHCYPLYPPQMIFVSFLLLECTPRERSKQDPAEETQQELKWKPLSQD